jgi:micrococcal nuclease
LKTPTFVYRAVVLRIVDGDTVDLDVDLGFRASIEIRTRLIGINAPELNTETGRLVRDALAAHMPPGSGVVVRTFKDPRDKYGRWVSEIEHNGVDVSHWMLDNGHAAIMTGPRS